VIYDLAHSKNYPNPYLFTGASNESKESNYPELNMLEGAIVKKGQMISIFIKAKLGLGISRIRPVKVILSKLSRFLYSHFSFNVQGQRMFLDPADTLSLTAKGIYEPFETDFLRKEIKEGYIVLDIGANIGYYTLIAAKLVGKNGRVFAFEPDPTNFALLKRNVEVNGYRNVELVRKAVSNKTGKIKLYLGESDTADHRIYDSHDGRKSIEIEAIRLDDYFIDYLGKINFIKMDTQGSESGVIQGGVKLLKKNRNVKVVTEFWPIGLKRFGVNPEEYLKLLMQNGFKIYELNESKRKIESADILKLLEIYTPEKENYTNLLCVRENRQAISQDS
jgi:FkbM family methyltransferase